MNQRSEVGVLSAVHLATREGGTYVDSGYRSLTDAASLFETISEGWLLTTNSNRHKHVLFSERLCY